MKKHLTRKATIAKCGFTDRPVLFWDCPRCNNRAEQYMDSIIYTCYECKREMVLDKVYLKPTKADMDANALVELLEKWAAEPHPDGDDRVSEVIERISKEIADRRAAE